MADRCAPLEPDAQIGGYECNFVEDPPEYLVCSICICPFKEPHLVSCCGKKFCVTCIKRVEYAGQPCPMCRTYGFLTLIDRDFERQVLNLRVNCNLKAKGCGWVSELRRLDDHLGVCPHVEVACKYNCGYRCPRQDMPVHEEDECNGRPLELILIKKIEVLERKVITLEQKCIIQDNVIADQRQQLDEQRRELNEQKQVINEYKGEFEDHKRTVTDDRQKLLNQIHQVEGTHRQCIEEWKLTFDDHVQRVDIQREEDVDKVRELDNKITEGYQHQVEEQKHIVDEVRELTEKCMNTIEQQREENERKITALENQLQEQEKTITERMDTELAKHQMTYENNVAEMTDTIERVTADQDQKITHLREEFKQLTDQMNDEVNRSAKEVIVKIQEELKLTISQLDKKLQQDIVKIKDDYVSKTALKKVTDPMDRMCIGFKVPAWQRPCPLTSFSSVPPCQFTMMRFKVHRDEGKPWYSPPFYSEPGGYKLCLRIDPRGMLDGKESHLSVWVYVMKGRFDDSLKWPFTGKVTVQLLNWLHDRGHIQNIVSFDDAAGDKVRARVLNGKYAATGRGSSKFLAHSMLDYNREKSTQFCQDDCLCFKILKVEVL